MNASAPRAISAADVVAEIEALIGHYEIDAREGRSLLCQLRPFLARYAELRTEQAEAADALFWKQRRETERAERDAMRRELVEQYPASRWWPLVRRMLDE